MGPQQGEKGEQESKQHFSGVRDMQGSRCWEFQVMFPVLVPMRPKGVQNCNIIIRLLTINVNNRFELFVCTYAHTFEKDFRAFKMTITP